MLKHPKSKPAIIGAGLIVVSSFLYAATLFNSVLFGIICSVLSYICFLLGFNTHE